MNEGDHRLSDADLWASYELVRGIGDTVHKVAKKETCIVDNTVPINLGNGEIASVTKSKTGMTDGQWMLFRRLNHIANGISEKHLVTLDEMMAARSLVVELAGLGCSYRSDEAMLQLQSAYEAKCAEADEYAVLLETGVMDEDTVGDWRRKIIAAFRRHQRSGWRA